MYWLVALMSFAIVGVIVLGFYLDRHPDLAPRLADLFKPALAVQMTVFVGALVGVLVLGIGDAVAAEAAVQAPAEVSIGLGLAIIGVGIPTAVSTIGAAIAVGPIGSAALAAITEKPEMLGRSLVYIGLAEGIAIYGLVVSILLLNRI